MTASGPPFPNDVFLLVDDSPDDLLLFERALNQVMPDSPVVPLESAEHAIDYLEIAIAPGERRPLPLPTAIVTDLKMPRMNGFELLGWIRSQPALRDIVVIALSGSNLEKDVILAYELGANCFLTKETKVPERCKQVQGLVEFIRLQPRPGKAPSNSSPIQVKSP